MSEFAASVALTFLWARLSADTLQSDAIDPELALLPANGGLVAPEAVHASFAAGPSAEQQTLVQKRRLRFPGRRPARSLHLRVRPRTDLQYRSLWGLVHRTCRVEVLTVRQRGNTELGTFSISIGGST